MIFLLHILKTFTNSNEIIFWVFLDIFNKMIIVFVRHISTKKTLLICKGSAEFPSSGPASEHERAGILADTSPKNRLISTLRTMSTQMDSPEIMYGFIDVW